MSLFKRIAMLVLVLALVFSFAACTSTDDPEATDEATDVVEDATDEPADEPAEDLVVDVFIYKYSDTYIASVRDYMDTQFAGVGITANFYDANEDQATQTQQVETAITQGTDLLIVNIVTSGSEDAAMTIVELARDADLPLIFFNREVDDEVVNSYDKCAFVGTDADEAGYMQGQLVYDTISADPDAYDLNGDGEIAYIMFKGELGNAEADGRTQYSVEEANRLLEADGLPTLVYYDSANTELFQPCNWDSAEAQDAMLTALNTNPFTGDNPIELVMANNDDMALGAIEALNEVGYNQGLDEDGNLISEDSIPVVGVDATDVAQEAIAAQRMTGTIKQDAEAMAAGVVYLAQNIQAGNALFDGADTNFTNIDEGVNKVRIPYAIV